MLLLPLLLLLSRSPRLRVGTHYPETTVGRVKEPVWNGTLPFSMVVVAVGTFNKSFSHDRRQWFFRELPETLCKVWWYVHVA